MKKSFLISSILFFAANCFSNVASHVAVIGKGGSSAALASSKLPNQVSGLVAWFKTDSVSGSDGAAETALSDSSGNGNNAVGTATLRTGLNGKNGLNIYQYDGVGDKMNASSLVGQPYAQPYSIFLVFKLITVSAGPSLLKWGSNCIFQVDNGGTFWDPQCGNGTDRSIGSADSNWHIFAFIFNGASSVYRIDGGTWTVFPSDPGSGAMLQFNMGSNDTVGFCNCYIAESFCYSTGISATSDGDPLFNGLNSKWNVY